MGKIIGTFAAVITEPPIFITAIILGILLTEYKRFIIIVFFSSLIIITFIHFQGLEWREKLGIYKSGFDIVHIYRFVGFFISFTHRKFIASFCN